MKDVMDINWIHCSDHFTIYANIKSSCFPPKLMLHSITSQFKKSSNKKMEERGELFVGRKKNDEIEMPFTQVSVQ